MSFRLLLTLALLSFSHLTYANDANTFQSESYGKYGVGIFGSGRNSFAETKTISFGHQSPLGQYFIKQLELGGWTDTRGSEGRRGNVYLSGSIGLNVDAGYVFAQSLWGVAALPLTDSYLGGHLEFKEDATIGAKDLQGKRIGLNYTHISSAGIFMPNHGRDLLCLRLSLPF